MSAKVVPVSEEAAAVKVQAITRGHMTRANTTSLKANVVATDDGVKKMEEKLFGGKNKAGFSTDSTGTKKKQWGLVRQKTGIKFDNWDMALQVVEAGWRGELAREVRECRHTESAHPGSDALLLPALPPALELIACPPALASALGPTR